MAVFILTLPDSAQFTLPDGANTMVVSAEDATGAKEIAAAQYTGDSNAAWLAATAVECEDLTTMVGYRVSVTVRDTDGAVLESVSVVGQATDDIDDIGGDLVTALNATDSIAGAAYSTPTLTVAAQTTDDLGDHTVEVEILPPATLAGAGKANLASLVASITDEGVAAADLTVVFVANTVIVPRIYGVVKST